MAGKCVKCKYMVDVPAEDGGKKPSCCFGYTVDLEHDSNDCGELFTEEESEDGSKSKKGSKSKQ